MMKINLTDKELDSSRRKAVIDASFVLFECCVCVYDSTSLLTYGIEAYS